MAEMNSAGRVPAPQGAKRRSGRSASYFREPFGAFPKVVGVLLIVLFLSLIIMFSLFSALSYRHHAQKEEAEALAAEIEAQRQLLALADAQASVVLPIEEPKIAYAAYTADSRTLGGVIDSEYAILIDQENNTVLASLNGDKRIYPASMTKVMTLIVAVEHMQDLNAMYTFSYEIINPAVEAGASIAGFSSGESVTLLDLLYGAALPSGADATAAIADYVAGSETTFAELMNEKVETLGLKNTHFVNASGLHNKDHYSTPHDIALIFEYAMQIPLLREVLSTYQYTTTPTEQHPEGLLLTSTLFSRVRGDEPGNAEIVAGKTGYTLEGKNCLVSMAQTPDGYSYILVTASASGKYAPIYDAIDIYRDYLPDAQG